MLPSSYRLTKSRDFEKVLKEKKSFFTPLFVLKTTENNLDCFRVGIIVSQKISKKATQRNKIKRILREAIRKHLKQIRSGFDIVILSRPAILNKEYKEVEKYIKIALSKAHLLKTK